MKLWSACTRFCASSFGTHEKKKTESFGSRAVAEAFEISLAQAVSYFQETMLRRRGSEKERHAADG